MVALVTWALPPSSQTRSSASTAFFACHQWSATTATASSSLTTLRTPLPPAIWRSSTAFSLPPNTGDWITAACSMLGTRTSIA